MLAQDKKNVEKILPYLEGWVVDLILSPDFADSCNSMFDDLDTDKSNSLDATELFPAVVQMSEAHPVSVTLEHCERLLVVFDEDKNGTISREEFMDFAGFILVVAYLESECGHECRQIIQGERKTEDMLAKLKEGKEYLWEVIPYLPPWLMDLVMSEDYARSCLARFAELDADGNGTLDPAELYPVVLELSEAHPVSVELSHCRRMLQIFDEDKNGVISRGEFVNFARFVMVAAFLESPDGQNTIYAMEECKAIEQGEQQVEELLQALKQGKEGMKRVLPFLPRWLADSLCDEGFAAACQQRFEELDADKNGFLDPAELYPVVLEMSEAHPFSVDMEHCVRLLAIFDTDKNGVISRGEFVDFAMFVMISCYLETEEGKKLSRTAESPVVQRLQQNAEVQQVEMQRLSEENEELRLKTQDLEAKLRAVMEKVDRLGKAS